MAQKIYEKWLEYDGNNNVSHFKDSNGIEWWATYDAAGHMLTRKDKKGINETWEYNAGGYVTHYTSNSNEYSYTKLEG